MALGRGLGIDEEPVADLAGVRGMQVTKVYAGSPADRVGLRAGDVIYSANGYLTTERGNLAWIITEAAPDNVLKMSVRSVVDGKQHTILVNLAVTPVSLERPSFLPPVGNGPPPASR